MIDQETLGASLAYTNKALEALKNVVHYLGVTTTTLSDGATTNPITIGDRSVTAVNGDMVFYNGTAYTWDGTEWQETLSIAQIITQIETITEEIGNLSNLTTEEKSNLVGAINEIVADIPKNLSDLQDDATHRLVTDTEKSTWNGVSLKTATGNPIALTDAANANAEELLMTIEPIQSGSGDPSPTNVRPISGISEAVVTRTGKNLIDETALINALLDPTTGQPSPSTEVKITPMISIKSSVTYLFAHQNGDAFRIFAYAADGTFIERTDAYTSDVVVTTGATWAYVRIQGANGAWAGNDPVLTQTVDITIQLGQTVYGGSVNFKTGEVTVTHANIASYNGESINEPWLSSLDKYESGATPTTGAQVVYPLSTPITLTLTPAELELLKGNNTITANGTEISIEYYPDNAIGALAERVDDKADKEDVAVPKYDATNRREYFEGGSAFDGNIDSVPTAGSNNAVSSGGTKTYVDNAVSGRAECFISSSNNAAQSINIGTIAENRIFLFACGFHTNYVLELIAISANGANVAHVPVANSSINSISNISYNANTGVMNITVLNNPFGYGRMTRLS